MSHRVQIEKNIRNGCPRKVNIDGFLFPSIGSVYKEYGISPVSITTLKNNGMSYEEAISYAIDHVAELNDKRQERANKAEINRAKQALARAKRKERERQALLTFQGKTYETFRRAVEDLSWDNDIFMNPASIKASAKKNNKPLEEQLQITMDKHLARKNKEEAAGRKKYGAFHKKMMGEIYHEAVQMVLAGGLSSLLDEGAAEIIAENIGVSLDDARDVVKDLIENEHRYSRFDYENREKIRYQNKYWMYSDIYKRWDWK